MVIIYRCRYNVDGFTCSVQLDNDCAINIIFTIYEINHVTTVCDQLKERGIDQDLFLFIVAFIYSS
jgi:hypothetical protein